MESFGEKLHNARIKKELDLETISREISIDKRYLQGLEEEDNSAFPGEAYMVGFLRNYSNYLELDTELLLKLYNNKKIQESPVPVELITRQKPKWFIPAIIIPSGLVLGVILIVSICLIASKSKKNNEQIAQTKAIKTTQYELGEEKFSKRLYKGDQIVVPSDSEKIILTVRETRESFGLDTPSGVFFTDLAEETEIDINGDKNPDLIIYVSDISTTDEARGAEVSILARQATVQTAELTFSDEIPLASELKNKHPYKVIIEDNRPYPFTLNASFLNNVLFRSRTDSAEPVETYFTKGEVFTANPRNGMRLWISNCNSVKFTIVADTKTYNIDIGKAGKVLVEDIKWVKDSDGKYRLVLLELD